MPSFEIVEPHVLEEALSLLDADDSSVRPIGGGTALMLMMKAQLFAPTRLVALRKIAPGLSGVVFDPAQACFRIGATTTFAEIEHHPEIRQHLPVIPHTMKTLANVRVRNVATVGGNLAHGDPHLDLPPVWAALGASVTIVGPSGQRRMAVEDLFLGYYETAVADGEIITELDVPVRPGWRATYVKVTTRAAHDWPALGIAISAQFDGPEIRDIRLVLSAALDKPTRLLAAENVLRGGVLDTDLLRRAGAVASDEVEITGDSRGSAEFKAHLLRVHLSRALQALAAE